MGPLVDHLVALTLGFPDGPCSQGPSSCEDFPLVTRPTAALIVAMLAIAAFDAPAVAEPIKMRRGDCLL